jgi:hypothetical protein
VPPERPAPPGRGRPSPPRRRGPAGRAAALAPLLSVWILAAACLCPPSDRDLLDVGFRSPEQAFRTFQTAVRADDPELEYRCFSAGFRRRNALGQRNWRVAREDLRRSHPWLRTGIAKAKITSLQAGERSARLEATCLGVRVAVDLVREDFAQLWEGAELVLDREAPFDAWVEVQAARDGERWITGGVPLPADADGGTITELRLGREWKIDDFREVDGAASDTMGAP